MEFERGNFSYLGVESEGSVDVKSALFDKYRELQSETAEITRRFIEVGVDPVLAKKYQDEVLGNFRNEVLTLKKKFAELLQVFREILNEYNKGEATIDDLMQRLSIVTEKNERGEIVKIEDTKWPIASQLITGGKEKNQRTYEVLSQFTSITFDFPID